MQLIVLTGVSGAGKDFLLEHLKNIGIGDSIISRYSFSDQLREVTTGIFPWLPNEQSQEFKNNPYDHKSNDHNLSPRTIWKKIATAVRDIQDSIFAERLCSSLVQKIDLYQYPLEQDIDIISDLRSWAEFNSCLEIRSMNKIDVKFIRIIDPNVTKENCQEIDKPTFDFEVDYEFINYKTDKCLVDFHNLVSKICSGE